VFINFLFIFLEKSCYKNETDLQFCEMTSKPKSIHKVSFKKALISEKVNESEIILQDLGTL